MKRELTLSVAAILIVGSSVVWGKAHVPLNQVQICTSGTDPVARNIDVEMLDEALADGACRLPSCDFNNVVGPGEKCSNVDENGDGFCDLAERRASAVGITALCTPAPF